MSLVGTFAVLYFLGFTINTLTLMGLTLAIGLVVDDAIVVLENITRWIEEGTPPREAAHRGMDEIAFAVIAATVSTVAVFLPLAFLTDKTGRLFREFGITVATAVGDLGLRRAHAVADALRAHPPARGHAEHGVKKRLADALRRASATGYARVLRPALRRRGAMLVARRGLGACSGSSCSASIAARVHPHRGPRRRRRRSRARPRAARSPTPTATSGMAEEIVLATPEVEKTFSVRRARASARPAR